MKAFNWQLWAKGLLAAAIGGATTSATSAITDPKMLQDPKALAIMIAVGAAVGGLCYLKTHPPVDAIPDEIAPMAAAGAGAVADALLKQLEAPK
jgi:hypothetical protein